MAKYFSADDIRAALQRLAASRARSRLHDFLVVKRTFAIKGGGPAAIAQSEPSFIKALDELSATNLPIEPHDNSYFNPIDGPTGYRPTKYRSNGPNSTIGSNAWRSLLTLSDDKPRRADFAQGYVSRLKDFLHSSDGTKPEPGLADLAIWFFRSTDVEPIAQGQSPAAALPALVDSYVEQVGLTSDEIAALFETGLPAVSAEFMATPAAPDSYLPPRGSTKPLGTGLPSTAPTKSLQTSEIDGACSAELVTALAAKPFVILSGPSGTGKSRLALKLAEGVQATAGTALSWPIFSLVPVGPDWTSPRRLLGHRTPFGATRKLADGTETNDSYELTAPLRLMLRALHPDATGVPHFLILDEMNLSHVERYFAPFLSLMEASSILEQENAPALLDQDALKVLSDVLTANEPSSPEAIAADLLVKYNSPFVLPANLVVVGTVNIDDTTYMFSPKVMDRAHVIELQAKAPSEYLGGSNTLGGSTVTAAIAEHLLKLGIDDREDRRFADVEPPSYLDALEDEIGVPIQTINEVKASAERALEGCFRLLAPIGFQFGYRTVKEVYQYLYYWGRASHCKADQANPTVDWDAGLDNAILQKVLPKLHGNRRSLLTSLPALAAFLGGADSKQTPPASYPLGSGEVIEILPGETLGKDRLPKSARKLRDMERRLSALGYVSFVG